MPYDDETAKHLRWWFGEPEAPTMRYAVPPARRATAAELAAFGALRADVENARLTLSLDRCDPVAPAARALASAEALIDAADAFAGLVLSITEPHH